MAGERCAAPQFAPLWDEIGLLTNRDAAIPRKEDQLREVAEKAGTATPLSLCQIDGNANK